MGHKNFLHTRFDSVRVQLLLGHTKIESTVRYLGIEAMMLLREPSKPTFDANWALKA